MIFTMSDDINISASENDDKNEIILQPDELRLPRRSRIVHPVGFRFGAYVLQWGESAQEYVFTPQTNFHTEYYDKIPLLYNHAMDASIGYERIGYVDTVIADSYGLRVEGILEYISQWYPALLYEIIQKKVTVAMSTAPHLRKIDEKTKEVLHYTIIEFSLILNLEKTWSEL